MKPVTCDACSSTGRDPVATRRLPCAQCSGKGFTFIEGDDPWERYRAHFNITLSPRRLAFEESLDECFGPPD